MGYGSSIGGGTNEGFGGNNDAGIGGNSGNNDPANLFNPTGSGFLGIGPEVDSMISPLSPIGGGNMFSTEPTIDFSFNTDGIRTGFLTEEEQNFLDNPPSFNDFLSNPEDGLTMNLPDDQYMADENFFSDNMLTVNNPLPNDEGSLGFDYIGNPIYPPNLIGGIIKGSTLPDTSPQGFHFEDDGTMTPVNDGGPDNQIGGNSGNNDVTDITTDINPDLNQNPATGDTMYDPDRVGQNTPFGGVNFTVEDGVTTANQFMSPDVQSLFTKVFNPDSYQSYQDDYMGRYRDLVAPDRAYNKERFEQGMANRGQPVGGEEYGAKFRQTIGDPNNRADLMASQAGMQFADRAKMDDWNRLMSAMGRTGVPTQSGDVLGQNQLDNMMQVNRDTIDSQKNSDIWNTIAGLGGSFMQTDTFDDWMKKLFK